MRYMPNIQLIKFDIEEVVVILKEGSEVMKVSHQVTLIVIVRVGPENHSR